MRQKIEGYKSHADKELLEVYSPHAPTGEWDAKLDYHAWGKSTNLFCFFTSLATGEKYRLSVFSRSSYQPYKGVVSFDQEPVGAVFKLATKEGKDGGLSKFIHAEKLDI